MPFSRLIALPVREQIGRFKYVDESECKERYDAIVKRLDAEIRSLSEEDIENA